jgi:hypothetical protein
MQLPTPTKYAASIKASHAQKNLWALDFDGVVCDSVGESSLSAWKAAAQLWPDIFNTGKAREKKDEVLEKMRHVRPVVETGMPRHPIFLCYTCTMGMRTVESCPSTPESVLPTISQNFC